MNPKLAAQIVALRPCFDALVVRACLNPEMLETSQPDSIELIELLKEISSELGWMPTDSEFTQNPTNAIPTQRQPSQAVPSLFDRPGGGFRGGRGSFGGAPYNDGTRYGCIPPTNKSANFMQLDSGGGVGEDLQPPVNGESCYPEDVVPYGAFLAAYNAHGYRGQRGYYGRGRADGYGRGSAYSFGAPGSGECF